MLSTVRSGPQTNEKGLFPESRELVLEALALHVSLPQSWFKSWHLIEAESLCGHSWAQSQSTTASEHHRVCSPPHPPKQTEKSIKRRFQKLKSFALKEKQVKKIKIKSSEVTLPPWTSNSFSRLPSDTCHLPIIFLSQEHLCSVPPPRWRARHHVEGFTWEMGLETQLLSHWIKHSGVTNLMSKVKWNLENSYQFKEFLKNMQIF